MEERISFSSRITSIVCIINSIAIILGMYELKDIQIPKSTIYIPLIIFILYFIVFSTFKEVSINHNEIIINNIFGKKRIFSKSEIKSISKQKILLYGIFLIPHYIVEFDDTTRVIFSGITNGFNWTIFSGNEKNFNDLMEN